MDSSLLLFFETFFMLLFGHCLADFPLQGDFLAKTKDPSANHIEFWLPALLSHSMIQAGMVVLITGYFSLALVQLFTHFITDYGKCMGWFGTSRKSFVIDQVVHLFVLLVIAGIFVVLSV